MANFNSGMLPFCYHGMTDSGSAEKVGEYDGHTLVAYARAVGCGAGLLTKVVARGRFANVFKSGSTLPVRGALVSTTSCSPDPLAW